MAYEYVKRTYGVEPKIGARVRHTENEKTGVIVRPAASSDHYVFVRFDGQKHGSPCHPLALDYTPGGDHASD